MCRKIQCSSCSKATWAGCGAHIESALQGVAVEDRCPGWETGKCPGPVTEFEATLESNPNQDDQILAQQNQIQDQIAAEQPLIGSKIAVSSLRPEYERNPSPAFVEGIDYLDKAYPGGLRRVRGDGNCFYRGLLFGLLEQLVLHRDGWGGAELARLTGVVEGSGALLVALGYSEVAFEMFQKAFLEELRALGEKTPAGLEALFNEEGGAGDYLVWYCRLLAAAQFKGDPEAYLPFLGGADVDSFCQAEVEPMGKECEQVQIMALTRALGITVAIEYLDGSPLQDGKISKLVLPSEETGAPPAWVTLLYRPGHFDILYPVESADGSI